MRARTNRSAALPAAACVPVPTGRLHCLLLHAWLYQQVGCVSCCYMRARAVGLCSSKNVQVQARLQLKHHMDLELLPFQLISHYACVALILRLLCCAGAHQAEAHGAGSAAEGDLGGGHGRAQRVGCGGGVALMAATGGWRGVVTDRLVGAAWALGPLGPCGPPFLRRRQKRCFQAGLVCLPAAETVAKYEIMDGAPVRGESIPIRCAAGRAGGAAGSGAGRGRASAGGRLLAAGTRAPPAPLPTRAPPPLHPSLSPASQAVAAPLRPVTLVR